MLASAAGHVAVPLAGAVGALTVALGVTLSARRARLEAGEVRPSA
ncbi:hypothetical protein ABZ746_18485 [Streptomyces sp. NPDC020096]